jgi:uncharacterized protein YbjT (DUF2867 family)
VKIAITGGTGFVGSHLARALLASGEQVVLVARGAGRHNLSIPNSLPATFMSSDLSTLPELERAFSGCDAVAHCAGINRETGSQTYARVHVQGTANVIEAARRAKIPRIVFLSFLRARPHCGSAYHESKWAAEELVRNSGMAFTVFKAGMIYGRGDHMLDHLSRAFHTLPVFATVGFQQKPVQPLAIDDLIAAMQSALLTTSLVCRTVAITGAEELLLSDAARRVGDVLGKRILVFPAPIWFHKLLAIACEWSMKVPLVARAQVRILSEGVTQPWGECDPLPRELVPQIKFTSEQIRYGLPGPSGFGLRDLRCCKS